MAIPTELFSRCESENALVELYSEKEIAITGRHSRIRQEVSHEKEASGGNKSQGSDY